MDTLEFFEQPQNVTHKQYEALRAFYVEQHSAKVVAERFGYTLSAFYSLARDFKQLLRKQDPEQRFFVTSEPGRKPIAGREKVRSLIITLRKKYLSVADIKAILDALDASEYEVSESYIYETLVQEGFARLPRRSQAARQDTLNSVKLEAPKSVLLERDSKPEQFQTQNNIGVLCLLPYIQAYGIDKMIEAAPYPATTTLPKLNSVLSFVALKLANVRRYTADDLWCMDRGLGVFAGLNVLPKAAWFTSYSHRVTRQANMGFLKSLNRLWAERGLLSDTANLDFVSIPYWGDDSHLENNWSGTRHKALASILAVLGQDPDTGIVTYGDTNVRHSNKNAVVIEFLDFYRTTAGQVPHFLVFDSKLTTYQNLRKLDEDTDGTLKFITIRRRGKNIVEQLEALPNGEWKKIRVPTGNGKTRQIRVHDQTVFLKDYGKNIRQIALSGHGKIKPALIITNDFDIAQERVVHKYARRWLVEQDIAEQIHFFHLNRVSSSMVIKVDFDLTMSILAHNLYRLLAADLPGYTHSTAISLFEKFLHNSGEVEMTPSSISVKMRKKRNLPALLSAMNRFHNIPISWMHNRSLHFSGSSYS